MSEEWKVGQRAYTSAGSVVEYVAHYENGFLVRPIVLVPNEYGDDEEYGESVHLALRIFKQPPVAKLHEEVKQLSDEAAALRSQINDARTALLQVRKQEDAVQSDIAKRAGAHEALNRIFDFIEGNITHFVTVAYDGPRLLTHDEALVYKGEDGRPTKELKLLTLFGRSNGDLGWKIHRYPDGGSSSIEAWPFTSLESARKKIVELIQAGFDSFIEGERVGYIENWIAEAERLSLPIPDAVTARLRTEEEARLKSNFSDATKKRDEAQKKLREFRRAAS